MTSVLSTALLFNSSLATREEDPPELKIVAHASASTSSSKLSWMEPKLGVAEAASQFPSNFLDSASSIIRVDTRRSNVFVWTLPKPDSSYTLALFQDKNVESNASKWASKSTLTINVARRLCEIFHEQLTLTLGSLEAHFQRIEKRDLANKTVDQVLGQVFHEVNRQQEAIRLLELQSGGMRYLGMDQLSFLNSQSLLSRVRETCQAYQTNVSDIKLAFFAFSSVIWSDLSPKDTRKLLFFLQGRCEEAFAPIRTSNEEGSVAISPFGGHKGNFVCTSIDKSDEMANSTTVYLGASDDCVPLEEMQLVVYCALQTVLCLFVGKEHSECFANSSLLTALDALLGPKMTQINSELAPNATRFSNEIVRSKSEVLLDGVRSRPYEQTCFFYLNEANLATRANFAALSEETQRALMDASSMLDRTESEPADVYVKTCHDIWIVGRKAFGRRVLLSLSKECANLTDAAAECSRVMETHFKNIFLPT